MQGAGIHIQNIEDDRSKLTVWDPTVSMLLSGGSILNFINEHTLFSPFWSFTYIIGSDLYLFNKKNTR